MNKFKLEFQVEAPDIINAQLIKEGVQNIINELGQNTEFLTDMADIQTCKNFAAKLKKIIDNPMIKKFAKTL